MTYERLLTYGNIIQLDIKCNIQSLLQELKPFKFAHYNSLKPDNPRFGLSVTSLDGELNGADLESLYETGMKYNEMDFRCLTDVYFRSKETRKLIDPFKDFVGRSHYLSIKSGGFFPPHRDDCNLTKDQHTVRVIVPLVNCNPPYFYYNFDGRVVNLEAGCAYFMNTNLEHNVFSFSNDNLLMVMNIEAREETYNIITKHFLKK